MECLWKEERKMKIKVSYQVLVRQPAFVAADILSVIIAVLVKGGYEFCRKG